MDPPPACHNSRAAETLGETGSDSRLCRSVSDAQSQLTVSRDLPEASPGSGTRLRGFDDRYLSVIIGIYNKNNNIIIYIKNNNTSVAYEK